MSRAVNFVWNFCKETQITALRRKNTRMITDKKTGAIIPVPNYLSAFELNNLVAGSSKELGLQSHSIQSVAEEYVTRRKQFKKLLRWRGKKSTGWIPFKASGIRIENGSAKYLKHEFKFWESRTLPEDAKIKTGSFTEDAQGHWYIAITFESAKLEAEVRALQSTAPNEIGIDLGIKTLATLSSGEKIDRPGLRPVFLDKIRKLEKQRAFKRREQSRSQRFNQSLPKTNALKKLHQRVKNQRKDYLHKESTRLVRSSSVIVVGDLKCAFMNRSQSMSGVSLDTGIGMFKSMLRYKAVRAGVVLREVSERNSTQTCSECGWQHSTKNRIGLGVREWNCPQCLAHHDRDINAAKNILRLGRQTPIRAEAA